LSVFIDIRLKPLHKGRMKGRTKPVEEHFRDPSRSI
jgi:hypothetical protein